MESKEINNTEPNKKFNVKCGAEDIHYKKLVIPD